MSMTKKEERQIDGWIGKTLFTVAPNADEQLHNELTQEGWVAALNAYESFNPEGGTSLQNWIITYVKRDMVRFIENEQKHEFGHEPVHDFLEVDDLDEFMDEEYSERLDEQVDLSRFVAILPERELNVVEKFYFEDRSELDIAIEMGISRSVVRKLRYRALERMRNEFSED